MDRANRGRVNHGDAVALVHIDFTPKDLELLRLEAELARAFRIRQGIHSESYPERRYEFVSEYMRGAEPATHERQQKWLRKIKAEVRRAHGQQTMPEKKSV